MNEVKSEQIRKLLGNRFPRTRKPSTIVDYQLSGSDEDLMSKFRLKDWRDLSTQDLDEFKPIYKFLNVASFQSLLPELLEKAIDYPGFLLSQNLVGELFSDLTCAEHHLDGSNLKRLASLSSEQLSCLHIWLDFVAVRWAQTDKKGRRPRIDEDIEQGKKNVEAVNALKHQ